jgi:hypothetical protein
MDISRNRNSNQTGVALLTALGLLFLFAMLGASFVAFMSLENDNTKLEAKKIRAREAARGGAQAALGEVQEAMAAGRAPRAQMKIDLPVFAYKGEGELRVRDDMRAFAEVSITPDGDKFKVASKGVCGNVGPGGELYHTSSLAADAVFVISEGKPKVVSWSEHRAQ